MELAFFTKAISTMCQSIPVSRVTAIPNNYHIADELADTLN
jgi:hypothetical protein